MRVAITSTGKELTSEIDPRFGRAAYFIIVDSETMDYKVVENQQNFNLPQGAGIQAGKMIVDNNVDVLITGNCGPKAFNLLQHAKVQVIIGAQGKVIDTLSRYRKGELDNASKPNVEGHWV